MLPTVPSLDPLRQRAARVAHDIIARLSGAMSSVRVISLVDGNVGEEIEGTRGFAVRAGLTPPHVG